MSKFLNFLRLEDLELVLLRFRLMIYLSSNYRTRCIHYKSENIAGIQLDVIVVHSSCGVLYIFVQ